MSWHGVEAVDDAVEATRGFLLPVGSGRWIRVAVLSLFVGVPRFVSTAANAGVALGVDPAAVFAAGAARAIVSLRFGRAAASLSPGALAAVTVAVALALAAVVLSAVSEFVLVDAIASDRLGLRRAVRAHVVDGLRLVGFYLGLAAAFVVPPAAVAAFTLAGTSADAPLSRPPALAALAVAALAYLLAFWLAARLTREFVVPAMVADDCGVVDGWRRVWPRLAGRPRQTVVYLLVHWLVGVGVSLVAGVLLLAGTIVAGLVVAAGWLAVVLAGGPFAPTLAGVGPVDTVVGVAAAAVLLVGIPVRVLTLTYLRSYELAALGRFAPGLDLAARYRSVEDRDGDREDADASGEVVDADGDGDDGSDADGVGFGGFVPATPEPPGGSRDDAATGAVDADRGRGESGGDDDGSGDDDGGEGTGDRRRRGDG